MPELPTGTVTFLFTDIEGSTKLWERFPEAMKIALARHDTLLRQAVESHGGTIFKTVGDAFCAAFSNAADALAASLDSQRALRAESWGEIGEIRVRMALHTGAAEERNGDYFGPTLNRVARLMAVGYGGQILLSLAAMEAARNHLLAGVSLRDLGERRLKDLIEPERIYQIVSPDLPADFPALKTLDARPNNLPAQLTSFIGRERELEAIAAALRRKDVRLLTLTGPGGTGKTRLSLQAAASLVDEFEHGVYFVALAAIRDPALVTNAILQALGVTEAAGESLAQTLTAYLRERQLLLVLDNFEQIVDAAPLVSELLAAAPRLKILVSSREALELYAEHEYPVLPLAVPDLSHLPPPDALVENEAVTLFVERARAVNHDFALDEGNAASVARLCVQLEGLPLAIELTAARCRRFAPQQIEQQLVKRLDAAASGFRDLPARQRTLRGAIDWSYDLLDDGEKALFARLGVFVGGWAGEAAAAICVGSGSDVIREDAILDQLQSLVGKSLLWQPGEVEGQPRFTMLETIREYALEKLTEPGEADGLRQRHLRYFRDLVQNTYTNLRGADQELHLNRLEAEHDNLRAALNTGLERYPDQALGLAADLWLFWYMRGHLSEGRSWLERALARNTQPSLDRAEALNGAGVLADTQGDYTQALAFYQQVLAFARSTGNKTRLAGTLNNLGSLFIAQGNYDRARVYLEESLQIKRELGDQRGISSALYNLGAVAYSLQDYAGARALFEESLSIDRERGDWQGIADSLLNLGSAMQMQVAYSQAKMMFEEALSIYRQLDDRRSVPNALSNLGNIALLEEDYSAARSLHTECMRLAQETGDKRVLVSDLEAFARLDLLEQQVDRACRLYAAAEAQREAIGVPLSPSDHEQYDADMAAIRVQLDETAFSMAYAAGKAMTLEQAIAYALENRQN